MERKIIFPLTRIHNPMLVEAHLEDGIIKEVYIVDTLYRGFEQILAGRPAFDMPYYTQRICGICSSAHAITSSLAVEQALGMHVPPNGRLLRNLIVASDFLQNHIRHQYLYAMPDYFKGPDIYPFIPHLEGDIRLSKEEDKTLTEHYFKALEISRLSHAAFAVFGGKAPHGHGIVPGGVTMDIDADKINRYRGYLIEVLAFIDNVMLPDMDLIVKRYPDYIDIGKGTGDYFSVGGFTLPEGSTLFASGVLLKGKRQPYDDKVVTEEVTTAWYKPREPEHPFDTETEPDKSQPKGYTWVKAPRYQGSPMEVGPLARAIINKDKVIGYGALGRIWARAQEAKKIALACFDWLDRLELGGPTVNTSKELETGTGVGLFEAMRGSLGHWVKIEEGRVEKYQIITPSAWNFSSRDINNSRSVGESSLLGLKVQTKELKEAGRIIRSFDPCFSCSVHLIENNELRSLDVNV